ncbi:MAG: CDP-alcohol phosphatidyltransferase family protein [Candidatus Aenigmatarchaeota archaeon]
MLYRHRKKFEKFSNKIGFVFKKIPLTPNQWTITTIIPLFISIYFIFLEEFILSSIFFIIAAFFDLIDGSVARVDKKTTKLGAYLDTIMDRYVEGIILLALLFIPLPYFLVSSYVWISIYLFGMMMTTYAKSAAKEKELIKKELGGGFLERAERLIILFFGISFATINKIYLLYVLIILAILSNITAIQRVYIAIKGLKYE